MGLNGLHDFKSGRDRQAEWNGNNYPNPTLLWLLFKLTHKTLLLAAERHLKSKRNPEFLFPHPRYIPLTRSWISVKGISILTVAQAMNRKSTPTAASTHLHSIQTPPAKFTLNLLSVLQILWEHHYLSLPVLMTTLPSHPIYSPHRSQMIFLKMC